eukprot:CAMPEP_0114269190 /NCGR_PEP_ID=MMETSP0058-20121206/26452_1 /TAXON_ID=36894 /ORGANISM="Pyramimonas parkeae, CCMP726" /LENGTH=470 /DNA_ID=CAMNT_0001387603 /DNA_START=70 /DNA_END=1483 /DNA_ORIENTATION=+
MWRAWKRSFRIDAVCTIKSSRLATELKWHRALRTSCTLREQRLLVREYIQDSLYNPETGYFTSKPISVGVLPQPLQFTTMQGRSEYTRTLGQIYHDLAASWLTPVEIFRPWYARALAQYILEQHAARKADHQEGPLLIYEIGGGSGTCARDVLDFLAKSAPAVYATMEYTTMEISASLAEKQRRRVCQDAQHAQRYKVWSGCDAARAESWGPVDARPCFILMLEVMDNLPHDRVVHRDGGWMQTRIKARSTVQVIVKVHFQVRQDVLDAHHSDLEEVLEPVNDELIQRCLTALRTGRGRQGEAVSVATRLQRMVYRAIGDDSLNVEFLPTSCMALLDVLHAVRPAHRLIAADFNHLPDVSIPGKNAPLVASKRDGRTHDYSTYLVPRGDADIFFPTDFDSLKRIYTASRSATMLEGKSGRDNTPESLVSDPQVLTTRKFMEQHAIIGSTQTLDGYNPLLEDFTNTRIFLS